MHGPTAIMLITVAIAVLAGLSPLWGLSTLRARGRRLIEARLTALGETPSEISHTPYGSWWGTAGLTGGAVTYRVAARTSAGEDRFHEWAYDSGGLKTFAHGIWIPVT